MNRVEKELYIRHLVKTKKKRNNKVGETGQITKLGSYKTVEIPQLLDLLNSQIPQKTIEYRR